MEGTEITARLLPKMHERFCVGGLLCYAAKELLEQDFSKVMAAAEKVSRKSNSDLVLRLSQSAESDELAITFSFVFPSQEPAQMMHEKLTKLQKSLGWIPGQDLNPILGRYWTIDAPYHECVDLNRKPKTKLPYHSMYKPKGGWKV
jgi:hypothetical protein